jgi:hypothetical protein
MISEWLRKRVTPEEAEASNMVRSEQLGPDPVPFGFVNADWKELLAQMSEGDELWEFRSPPETWVRLCGSAGYALIRRGKVIASVETELN